MFKSLWHSRSDSLGHSLCWIPRPGSLTWGSKSSQQWGNFLVLLLSSLWVIHLVSVGFDFIIIVPLVPSCCSHYFVLDMGYLFLVGSSILLSLVVQQLVVILVFSQKEMSARHSTLPSWIRSSPKTVILSESISDEYSLSLSSKKKIKLKKHIKSFYRCSHLTHR